MKQDDTSVIGATEKTEHSGILPRPHISQQLKSEISLGKQTIFIQARAGQGKTTAARQYLSDIGGDHAFVDIHPEKSQDPVHFLRAVIKEVIASVPGLNRTDVPYLLSSNEIDPKDFLRYGEIVGKALGMYAPDNFHMVIDDAHLLLENQWAVVFLKHLIQCGKPSLTTILLSRSSIVDMLDIPPSTFRVFRDLDLEFSKVEIAELYNDIFGIPVEGNKVTTLSELTGGWIFGLKALKKKVRSNALDATTADMISDNAENSLTNYLIEEVVSQIPQKSLKDICLLATLPVLPLSFINHISSNSQTLSSLRHMTKTRLFTRMDNNSFMFHALFRGAMSKTAFSMVPEEDITKFQSRAADWFLHNNHPEAALTIALENKDWSFAETVFSKTGLDLHAQNQTIVLKKISESIPDEECRKLPWISLIKGMILMDDDPMTGIACIGQAANIFSETDAPGKLIAISQAIYFHVTVSGFFGIAEQMMPQAEALYADAVLQLPHKFRVLVANAMSVAACVVATDAARTEKYHQSVAWSDLSDLPNTRIISCILRSYQQLIIGNSRQYLSEVNRAFMLSKDTRVNHHTRMMMGLNNANMLLVQGEFNRFSKLKEKIEADFLNSQFNPQVMAHYMLKWDIDLALADGNPYRAEAKIDDGLALPISSVSPHMKSHFMGYKALACGILNNADGCRSAVAEAVSYRNQAGNSAFQIYTQLMAGAALSRIGDEKAATDYLTPIIEGNHPASVDFIRGAALANRAFLFLKLGNQEGAHLDIIELSKCIEKSGHSFFYTLTPDLVETLINASVDFGINSNPLYRLEKTYLPHKTNSSGTFIPLLKIRNFDHFSVSFSENITDAVSGIKKQSCELITALVTRPNMTISTDDMISRLWQSEEEELEGNRCDDSNTKQNISLSRQRSKLDTALKRLRQELAPFCAPVSPKSYISMSNNSISLINCQSDLHQFLELAKSGNYHNASGEMWEADWAYRSAFHLIPGLFTPAPAPESLQALFLDGHFGTQVEAAAIRWATILRNYGPTFSDDFNLLEHALRWDKNGILFKKIYHLYTEYKMPAEAARILRIYKGKFVNDLADMPDEMLDDFFKDNYSVMSG